VSAVNLSGPIAHQYDALGRRVGMNDETGTTTWAYDALGRPLSIAQPGGAVGYQYTARGQRRQMTYPGGMQIDYTYLPDGQLDLVRQGTTTLADYTYDGVGRVQQVARANGANSAYTYDQVDRLRELRTTSGSTEINRFQYQVDRLGNRAVVTETLTLSSGGPTATPTPTPPSGGSGAFQEQGGQVVMEAENASANVSRSGKSWVARTDVSGFAGSGFLRAEPDTGATIDDTTYPTTQPEARYQVTVTTPGTYHVWVRMYANDDSNNSVHTGLNGQAVASADKLTSSTFNAWTWTQSTRDNAPATLSIPAAGVYTINVWMREDGFRLDRLLLTTNSSFTPSGSGPAESPRGSGGSSAAAAGAPTAPIAAAPATPTLNPICIPEPCPAPTATPTRTPRPTATPTPAPLPQLPPPRSSGALQRTIRYAYDGLLRLTGAQESGSTTNQYSYAYDLAGNRTGVTVNGVTTTYGYDEANQVLGWTYDQVGNLLGDGVTTYTYDALHRLTETQRAGSSQFYRYMGDGLVIANDGDSPAGPWQALYDLALPLPQVVVWSEIFAVQDYVYGAEPTPLWSDGSGGVQWQLSDGLGSVRQTLTATRGTRATSFDSWGNRQQGLAFPFGFTGEVQTQMWDWSICAPGGMIHDAGRS
jgi:YD repeat-containing protein